jgi:hypothetical protein
MQSHCNTLDRLSRLGRISFAEDNSDKHVATEKFILAFYNHVESSYHIPDFSVVI